MGAFICSDADRRLRKKKAAAPTALNTATPPIAAPAAVPELPDVLDPLPLASISSCVVVGADTVVYVVTCGFVVVVTGGAVVVGNGLRGKDAVSKTSVKISAAI